MYGIVFVILCSCSDADSEIVMDQDKFPQTHELIKTNFLPTFENYFGRDLGTITYRSASLSVEWIHEYDEEGKLFKSQMFEKQPYRILKEVIFSDYDLERTQVMIQVKNYNYYSLSVHQPEFYKLNLTINYSIKDLLFTEYPNANFSEFYGQKWVKEIRFINQEGQGLYSSEYIYDENGKILVYNAYNSEGVLDSTVEYTYTAFGDPKSYSFRNTQGELSTVNYFYREDMTLERLEESYTNDDETGLRTITYTDDEAYKSHITNRNDGSKTIKNYFDEEVIEENYGSNENLIEVYKYRFNEYKYYLEIYEYYDENGDLEYTEYYDENGNVTETVYE
jgi:hypothetical protein